MSEAALSFLRFGLPIEVPSWGGMLSGEGHQYIEMAPSLALWLGLCPTLVVYALNSLEMPSGICSIPGSGAERAVTALRW